MTGPPPPADAPRAPRRWPRGGRAYAALTALWLVVGLLGGNPVFLALGVIMAAIGATVLAWRFASRLPFLRPLFVHRTVRITRDGLVYVGLTVVLGFAALNTGVNLLYLVFAMFLAMLLVSGVLSETSLRGIRVLRLPVPTATAGEVATLRLRIENRKWLLASHALRADEAWPAGLAAAGPGFVAWLPARTGAEVTLRVSCTRRGAWPLRLIRLSTGFPFGFIEHAWWHEAEATLLVRPRVGTLHRRAPQPADPRARPAPRGASAPGDDEFRGLREYREGDNPRQIHWRSSARAQKLLVREHLGLRRAPIVIVAGGIGTPEVLDRAMDCVATIAFGLARGGREVAVLLPGRPAPLRLSAGRGEAACLDALATWAGGPAVAATGAMRRAAWRTAGVLVVTEDPSDGAAAVAAARSRGARVAEHWSPADAVREGWVDFGRGPWRPSSAAPTVAASTT